MSDVEPSQEGIMKRVRMLIGMLGSITLAGCGAPMASGAAAHHRLHSTPPQHRSTVVSHAPRPRATPRTIAVRGARVTVPAPWTVSATSTQFGVTTVNAHGGAGHLSLSAAPLRAYTDQLLPGATSVGVGPPTRQPTLYEEIWRQPAGRTVIEQLLSPHGTLYVLTVHGTPALVQSLLAQWHHPPVATVTDAVHLIQHSAMTDASASQWHQEAWELVGGPVGAGQQPYYLFHSTNGGQSWGLERRTIWGTTSALGATPNTFLNSAGIARIHFWSAHDGVIAEAVEEGAFVGVYHTTNGGHTWKFSRILLPNLPTAETLRGVGPVLTLSVQVPGYPTTVERSGNGGLTWSTGAS